MKVAIVPQVRYSATGDARADHHGATPSGSGPHTDANPRRPFDFRFAPHPTILDKKTCTAQVEAVVRSRDPEGASELAGTATQLFLWQG